MEPTDRDRAIARAERATRINRAYWAAIAEMDAHRPHPVWVHGFVGLVEYTDPDCAACQRRDADRATAR
jgi:hypothetical protein